MGKLEINGHEFKFKWVETGWSYIHLYVYKRNNNKYFFKWDYIGSYGSPILRNHYYNSSRDWRENKYYSALFSIYFRYTKIPTSCCWNYRPAVEEQLKWIDSHPEEFKKAIEYENNN